MYNKDAPTAYDWWHWAVANIPATISHLPTGAGNDATLLTESAQQTNTDISQPGYLGLCLPQGCTHRYVLTVYALNTEKLKVDERPTPAQLVFMAQLQVKMR